MNRVQDLLAELYNLRFPKGIAWDDIAVHAEVDAYFGYIMGYASQYLKGKKINPDDIKINERLNQRLDDAIEALIELRDFKKRHDELVKELIDALANQC
jgi:hypothetical protein